MKKFERFIIYPMLFIALFFSFADDEVQNTRAQEVFEQLVAKEIRVVNEDGEENIIIDGEGEISLTDSYHKNQRVSIDSLGLTMKSEITDSQTFLTGSNLVFSTFPTEEGDEIEQKTIAAIGRADLEGGVITLNNKHGNSRIYLGADKNNHGVINIYDKYGEDYRNYSFR